MGKTPKEKTMSEDKELKEKRSQYHKLIDSEKFDMLELTLKEPNIFRILKSSRYEIRHSNFLAWLLDPKASHGLGDTILKRFVRYVLHKAEPNNLMLHQFNFSNVKIRREWKNIDLLIVFDNAVITIENKIFSGEGKEQLKKYKKIVTSEQEFNNKEKIYIFLTPDGIEATDNSYINISYQIFIDILERVLKFYNDNMADAIKHYINDYLITLKEDVMEQGEAVKLANELYMDNKEILDFIYEHKSDAVNIVNTIFEEIIKKNNRGYEFLKARKNYLPFIPPKYSAEKEKPKFCFNVYLHRDATKIVLEFIIFPWDDKEQDKREEFKKELLGNRARKNTNKWNGTNLCDEIIKTDMNSIYDDDGRKNLTDEFQEIWNKFSSTYLDEMTKQIDEFFEENP